MAVCSGGELQCRDSPGFPVFEARQCWTCIDPDARQDNTNTESAGCGSGCIDCYDYPADLGVYKASLVGKRFLRPARTGQNRNAEGFFSDLRSGFPESVPRTINYERAACWENGGIECFQDLCLCEPPPTHTIGINGCTDRYGRLTAPNGLLPGQFHDCVGVIDDAGLAWPKDDGGAYDCRHIINEHNEMRVPLKSGPLLEPMFHRDHACAANGLILATAKIAGSSCFSGYVNRDPSLNECFGCIYYGDGYAGPATRNRWDIMRIGENSARILDDASLPVGMRMSIRIKNAILDQVRDTSFPGPVRFDQLDNLVSAPGGSNGNLGHWRRTHDATGDPQSWVEAFRFDTLSRSTGLMNVSTLRIRKVWFEIHLFVLRVQAGFGINAQEQWWPYARCRIRAWTQIHPAVNQEQVIYLKDGIPFTPPGIAEWRGWLGAFSNPATRNILPWDATRRAPDFGCNGQVEMRGLAKRLGMFAGDYPAGMIPPVNEIIHGGSVTFNFGDGC